MELFVLEVMRLNLFAEKEIALGGITERKEQLLRSISHLHKQSLGLLQLLIVWAANFHPQQTPAHPESCCSVVTRARKYDRITPVLRELN